MSNYDDIQQIILRINKLKIKIDDFIKYRAMDFFNDPLISNRNDSRLLSNGWSDNKEYFSVLTSYLEKKRPLQKLKEGGLTGSQLKLKLHLVDQSLKELELQEKKFQLFKPEGKSKGFKIWHELKTLKNFWQQYFDHINTILSTLGVMGIPGSDAINEFVMLLEKLLHWWNTRKK